MKRFFVLIFFITIFVGVKAQEGVVTVNADYKVDSLITLHQDHNQKYPFIQGYRIQLFKDSGNEALDAAQDMIDKFEEDFPGLNTYLSFQEPYYRVRVGDFRTRLEALDYLKNIKRKYRNVWVIKDYIHFSDYQTIKN